jgi:hypothetical protein
MTARPEPLGRLYNEIIKEVFDKRGIYMGGDKQNNSPALRIEPWQVELGTRPATKTRKRNVATRNGLVEAPMDEAATGQRS